ncbi:aspartate/glutamate racemase family protein [Sphingoaurantiacus capsulatus]|uniref:Aspartate/glutamate racemase family protein n=1 Tax=Sphingoaurantiacus capsulatus TaxID=1771310 RepID=A0ABV7XAB2_9SPHN
MRTIGLLGGMSWESTAIYYRRLNELVRDRLGGLHSADLLLRSFDFQPIADAQGADDWAGLTAMMIAAAQKLEAGGAEAVLIGSNTMHRMADEVAAAISVPLLHIGDATAAAIKAAGSRKPLLLGTRFTMEGDFYRGRLRDKHGLDMLLPDAGQRVEVNRVIYDELCRGVIDAGSRTVYLDIVEAAKAAGADGVIFGCTEVGLLIGGIDLGVPSFDTAELHCAAAVDFMLG